MAELHIDGFPSTDRVAFGDVWHIQRQESGSWNDYQVRNRFMFGVDIATHTETYLIQDLLAGAQTFLPPPAPGEIYLPFQANATYFPGSITDGATCELLGHISFESGGNNGACCRFVFNGNVQGAALRSSGPGALVTGTGAFHFRITDATTSDGTIRVFAQYTVVTL